MTLLVPPKYAARIRPHVWWASMILISGLGFSAGKWLVGSNPLVTGSAWDWLQYTAVSALVGGVLYFLWVQPLDRWLAKAERRSVP